MIPFLSELIEVMERHDHLRLDTDVRQRLLSINPSTANRLLRPERERIKTSVNTTRRGSLLKDHIPIKTFTDFDDVIHEFMEIDLVAHCGGNTSGSFMNTLISVDISTCGLESIPILLKSDSDVIDCLYFVEDLLTLSLLGITRTVGVS